LRNKDVLQRIKDERNILQTIKRRKVNWIGHILCGNCLVKHDIEGKIEESVEMKRRRQRRCTHLLDDFKEMVGYCKLKGKH
jgi:hypothetical protein